MTDNASYVRVVLMTGPALDFVHRGEIPRMAPMPGVIVWGARYFNFTYQENPSSFVYREVLAVTIP